MINCNIIRSKRSTISITVKESGNVIIRAPYSVSTKYINSFLQKKKSWVQDKVREARENKVRANSLQNSYSESEIKILKKNIRTELKELVEQYSNEYGFEYNKVRISSARHRWGSCSGNNNLNFNWRIVFAPDSVKHYLVVHELAHTIHKNHQKKYWDLVSKIHPQYKQGRKWLRDHSYLLLVG